MDDTRLSSDDDHQRVVIFRSSSAPQDRPWMWTITGAVVAPRLPSHGFAETLDEAKMAFAKTWRQWLALKGGAKDQGARIVEKSK